MRSSAASPEVAVSIAAPGTRHSTMADNAVNIAASSSTMSTRTDIGRAEVNVAPVGVT
jgi:hypothetical protein